jgi:DNA-binding MarR family transcriptional regulator
MQAMEMKKIYVFGLLFFMSMVFQAQEFRIPDDVIYSYNSENSIYLFTANEIYEIDVLKDSISKPVEFENNGFDIAHYNPIKLNDVFYFVHASGGLVLKLAGNLLTRIDNSFDHKMQYGSAIFKYNNEIYRFGGYGFFSARNFIIKFDFDTNEWESITLKNNLSPSARFDFTYINTGSQFIIIGGRAVIPSNRQELLSLEDSWSYSFKDKEWVLMASSEYFKFFDLNFLNTNRGVAAVIKKEIYLYNFENLEIEIYNRNNSMLKLDSKFPIHFYDNHYYFVVNRNNSEKVLIKREKNEFFGDLKSSIKIKEEFNFLILFLILFGFSLLVIIGFYANRFFNFIFMYSDKIKYKRNSISISNDEYLVLSKFISNNNILENNKLQSMLDKKQYDRSHNVRLKNNLVESINSKFKYLLGDDSKQYIETQKSQYDGRYKRYFLTFGTLKIISKLKK